MHYRNAVICLITQSLLCSLCLAALATDSFPAEAGTVGQARQHGEKHAQVVTPVPRELLGYRIIVPVILSSSLDSKKVRIGDTIRAVLKENFMVGGKRYAPRGARVNGHVVSYTAPRTLSQALASSDRRLNSRAALEIQFDEIVGEDGARIPIVGSMSQQTLLVPGQHCAAREVKVDRQGRIIKAEHVLSPNQKRVYNTARVFTMMPLPGGLLLNVAGVPVAMGAAGAADPSFAYNKPVDAKVEHRRLKGMIYGFLTNLPGALLITSVVEKGNEIVLNAGDELAIDMCLGREVPVHKMMPFTVADVRGTILSENVGGGAPLPGATVPGSEEELVAQTAKYDDSLSVQDGAPPHPGPLISPKNGGHRLLPSREGDGPKSGGVRLFPSQHAQALVP